MVARKRKPTIFIGSCGDEEPRQDMQKIVDLIKQCGCAEPRPWSRPGVLRMLELPGDGVLRNTEICDFGLFLLTPDDAVVRRSGRNPSAENKPRANVILELGIFLGSVGKERVFILAKGDRADDLMPTDFKGVIIEYYNTDGELRDKVNLIAAKINALKSCCPNHAQRIRVLEQLDSLTALYKSKSRTLTNSVGFLSATRIIRNAAHNYALARAMIKRGLDKGMLVYETTNSNNDESYEEYFLKRIVAQKRNGKGARLCRIFSGPVNEQIVIDFTTVAESTHEKWATPHELSGWPHDLLVNVPQQDDGGQPEALIGISATNENTWMALHTTSVEVVNYLAQTCEIAINAGNK